MFYWLFCILCKTLCHAMWQNKIIKWVPEFLRSKHSEPSLNIFVWCLLRQTPGTCVLSCVHITIFTPIFCSTHNLNDIGNMAFVTLLSWSAQGNCPTHWSKFGRRNLLYKYTDTLLQSYSHTHKVHDANDYFLVE